MNIGQAASETGVSAKMIRYYESITLLKPSARTDAGYRVYMPNDLHALRFIKRAQSTGFSLAEIEALLTLRESQSCADTRALATRKLAIVEERLRDLRRLRLELKRWIDLCDHNPKHAPCPSIQKIAS